MLHVFSANSKKRAIIYTGLKGSFFLGLKRAVHFKQTFRPALKVVKRVFADTVGLAPMVKLAHPVLAAHNGHIRLHR